MQVQQSSGYLMQEVEDSKEKEDEEILTWSEDEDGEPKLEEQLSHDQRGTQCFAEEI